MSCCSTAVTPKIPKDYIFRVIASANVQGKAISWRVLADGFKKAVFVYRAEGLEKPLFRDFKKDFDSACGTVLAVVYQSDQSDYSA